MINTANINTYQKELYTTGCSVDLSAAHTDGRKISINLPKVIIQGNGLEDLKFTNDAPTNIISSPATFSYEVGKV